MSMWLQHIKKMLPIWASIRVCPILSEITIYGMFARLHCSNPKKDAKVFQDPSSTILMYFMVDIFPGVPLFDILLGVPLGYGLRYSWDMVSTCPNVRHPWIGGGEWWGHHSGGPNFGPHFLWVSPCGFSYGWRIVGEKLTLFLKVWSGTFYSRAMLKTKICDSCDKAFWFEPAQIWAVKHASGRPSLWRVCHTPCDL